MAGGNLEQPHPHLVLVREPQPFERRKKQGFGSAPSGDVRRKAASSLRQKLDEFQLKITKRKPEQIPGIKPHLVFRIPVHKAGSPAEVAKLFEAAGLTVVSYEPGKAIVVFKDDMELASFKEMLDGFERGPREGVNPDTDEPYKSTKWDVLQYVDGSNMRVWGRADRLGKRLLAEHGAKLEKLDSMALHAIDIELWYPGRRLADSAILEVEALLKHQNNANEKVVDRFVGDAIVLLRAKASAESIKRLLELDVVAEVELPPRPYFNAVVAMNTPVKSFKQSPLPANDAPTICVVDSGVTSKHPLLAGRVGAERSIRSDGGSAADEHGHGTLVAGLAVFGDVRACYASGEFSSPIRIHSARVLNERNEFDDDRVIINQMKHAISEFANAPHNCRVFNLSVGEKFALLPMSGGRQDRWAEALDLLARELEVLLIVSAGNITEIRGAGGEDAERYYREHPEHLFSEPNGLCNPATSAIAVTVGALAQHNEEAIVGSSRVVHALANPHEPAPFSRTGPGINGAVKPEFVDYGGNLAFVMQAGINRGIQSDHGIAAMSLGRDWTKHPFGFDVGTSFAAPLVANKAARIWKELERQLRTKVHPNLVRATMAVAACVPEQVISRLGEDNPDRVLRACGYGLIEFADAVRSTDTRVTLVTQDEIRLDHFAVYAVPAPTEFVTAKGDKFIEVALAFDPPVRSRRAEYLGVEMGFDLVRERELAEIIKSFSVLEERDEEEAAIQGSRRINFVPKPTTRKVGSCQRARSTLQKGTWRFKISDHERYGETFWLLVRAIRKWAPPEIDRQKFAVAVTLRAQEPRLYALVQERIQQRVQARQRPQS